MSDFRSQLIDHARLARCKRLNGNHHRGADNEFPLIGYCFDNAFVAWHLLSERNITAHLIEGTTERVADDLITEGLNPREFDSVDQLGGLVHYWLEVESPSGPHYTLDIASDSFETLGECLVVEGLPDDYIRLPDSRAEGQATLKSVIERDDRCQYCGDHRFTHGGCSKCEDTVSSDLDQSAPQTPTALTTE